MNRPGEDTLIRYFRGQCLQEEADAVRLYLAMNIDEDYVRQCLQEAWRGMEEMPGASMSAEQLDERWQQLQDRLPVHAARKAFRYRSFLRYAAVFALILTGALTYRAIRSRQPDNIITETTWQVFNAPKGKSMQLRLSDSSLITLFPGSSIRLPDDFNQQERTVLLQGRAFFDVTQDAQRPFRVSTSHLVTKVLGTAFDVNADEGMITLLNGRISVSYDAGEIATLDPGQQVQFDSLTHQWQISHVNAKDVTAWTSGEFIYESATLQQVLKDIENWYDVTIQINGTSVKHKEITTNFKSLSLEQVLTMITKASGLRYTITGKQVQISEAPR